MAWVGLALLVVSALAVSTASAQSIFCYYTSWGQYRREPARFVPSNIDPNLCNYAVYAFAHLENNECNPLDWNDFEMYEEFNALKLQNANLKTLLSIGGWAADMYEASKMMRTAENRAHFITQCLSYLNDHGFDGLELDFEYPASRNSSDRPEDRENFSALVRELKAVYGPAGKLVTAAVSSAKNTTERGYEVYTVCSELDFINVMTYDFHGFWEPVTGVSSPLCPTAYDYSQADKAYWNIQSSAYMWVNCGCQKDKMNIGMGTYGRSFTLASGANRGVGAPAIGAGVAGKYTNEPGFHSYYELCALLRGTDGTEAIDLREEWDNTAKSPYLSFLDVSSGDYVWTGYDDLTSFGMKVSWIKSQGFGGFLVWSYDLDDFQGHSEWCDVGRYPLINAMKDAWANPTHTPAQTACNCSLPAPGVPNSCGDPPPTLPVPPPVTCYGPTPPPPTPPPTQAATSTTTQSSTVPIECVAIQERCEEYKCDTQEIRCPPGHRYDSASHRCTGVRSEATCWGGDPPIPEGFCATRDGVFTLQHHCTFYISCQLNMATLRECGDFQVFSQSQAACVNPILGEGICQA